MKNLRTGIAEGWERLIAVTARDEEEARLGRLFNILMMISLGIVVALSIDFLLLYPLGFISSTVSWIAAAFPLAFIPLSIFCFTQARRGHIRPMVLLYSWVNLIAIGVAAWLFDGVYSPAWPLFIWTVTVAGILLAPASSLWITGGVLSYFLLLLMMTRSGYYTPPLTFGVAGREFVHMSALLIMLVSTVGLLTYLNMRSLREALGNLRQEIAVRKRTEEDLRQSEERLRGIVEHVGDIIYTVEADGTFSSISPSSERMLGWRPDEWIGRPFPLIVHPDDLPRMQELFLQVQAGKSLPVFQVRVLTKAGRYLESEIVANQIHRGNSITILWVLRDITERKRAEDIICKQQELTTQIIETVPIRVFWKDRDSRYLGCNTLFAKDAGLACPEELVGKTDFEMGWKDQAELYRADDRSVMESGVSKLGFDEPQTTPDGKTIWLRTSKLPLRDTAQSIVGILGIYDDVTERKQAEDQIRQLNEELDAKVKRRTQQLLEAQDALVRKEKLAVLGQIAGSVGHELRNPLGVMSNAVYFLQAVLPDADETTKEYLNIIRNEIAGSERIVSDLLDAVRTQPPHIQTVGIAELLGQILRKCSVPPSVTVQLDIPETLPPLRVDAMQIQQVFRNLISNGVEAMPEGGTLAISAVENKPDGTITISVRDSGIGIAPDVLSKLFQPLFTTKARGIGLGLVVVKNLTQANGGTVKVESEPGRGTVFTVTLPMDTAVEGVTQNG